MADETTAAPDIPAAPPQNSGSTLSSTLMTTGGVAAGVAIGAALGIFVLGPRLAPAGATHAPAAAAAEESKDHGSSATPPPIYLIENLVINPANSGGTRFLLLSIGLAAKDEAAVAQLRARDAELKDIIIRFFGAKTVEQVAESSAREVLRTELTAALGKATPAGAIRRVYFPQFVIQ